jgi:hypothetical protein
VVAAGIAAAIAVPRIKQQMGAGLGGPAHGYRFDQNDRALDPLPPLPGDRTP